ncbi:hypothetical protein B0I27_101210 [Arcticibacter pallidicorallinus]|uniref:Uncharacterized protein n=1 Tax=Arcticibacter pallidicorallinus TaxID=1259464 RepID=A0A2T0UBB8_9SPHI|nr:hypothetical protein [Arcticibacter pallidicorallinus]PRY55241.1 hypothetical protein B0I27_101210 [Arcticibacter pallidicorallinus]
MKTINFSAEFQGGTFGFIEVKLRRNGLVYSTFAVKGSGVKSLDTDAGLYLVSINGVSPSGGTAFTISEPTNPSTPDSFPEGPIYKGYVMEII